jgi:hypothetical protein
MGSIYIFNISGHAKGLAPGPTTVEPSPRPPLLSTRPTIPRTKASQPSSKTASAATATRTTTSAAKELSVQNKDTVSSYCLPKNSKPQGMHIKFFRL